MRFRNRSAAGQALAPLLSAYANVPGLLVLGLPRGGVPVAAEVARALGAELDVCLVRKLGAPGRPELAMGAVAAGGVMVLSQEVLSRYGVTDDQLAQIASSELAELERRLVAYRAGPAPAIHGRPVILVDDGLATGATMRAACGAMRLREPGQLIVAVPVAPVGTAASFADVADEVVVALTPDRFRAVGEWYADFEQTTDEQVRTILRAGR